MRPKKRTHSDGPDHEDGEVSNQDLLNAIAQLTKRMGDFESSMSKMVDEKVSGLEKSIMDQVDEYKKGTTDRVRRIEKRMDEFTQQVTTDMNVAKDDNFKDMDKKINDMVTVALVNATSGVTDSRIDQLERQVRMNELIVSGVPLVDNENLSNIMTSISKVINFSGGVDAIESCFRLPSHNNRRRLSPSIIVKFWGGEAKSDFFKQYFVTKKLCSTMLGFSAPSRIYVNENLTKRNFEIFCKARDLKKDGKIVRFNTQRGRVVVKLQGSEKSYFVDSLDQLSSLVINPATAISMDN